jgi:hypothetical protein
MSDRHFKCYSLKKIEILSFATHCFLLGQTGNHSIQPVSVCLPASPVGEQTAEEKLAALLSPSQPLDKLFSPGSSPHTTKVTRGHTGNE